MLKRAKFYGLIIRPTGQKCVKIAVYLKVNADLFFGRDPLGHYSSRLWQTFAHSATAAPFFAVRTSPCCLCSRFSSPSDRILRWLTGWYKMNRHQYIEGHFWHILYVFSRFLYPCRVFWLMSHLDSEEVEGSPHISIVFLSLLFHHATKGDTCYTCVKIRGGGLLQKIDFRRDYFRRVRLYYKRGRWQI